MQKMGTVKGSPMALAYASIYIYIYIYIGKRESKFLEIRDLLPSYKYSGKTDPSEIERTYTIRKHQTRILK